MLFVAGGLAFITFLTIAFVGIADVRTRFRRFEAEMEAVFPVMNHAWSTGNTLPTEVTPEQMDTLETACFSSSLFSVMKVHSEVPHHSPEVVSEETNVSAK